MAKFSRIPKLNKQQVEEIVIDLCEAIASTHNAQEAAKLLTDLLGKQELEMLAKRLKIAQLLLDGFKYDDIAESWKVSHGTIARVQAWLQQSGEGYRLAVKTIKPKRKVQDENSKSIYLRGMKKKYPMFYWPQILLEHWVKNSTQKQKKEMQSILVKLNDKPKVFKELETLLKIR